MNSKPTATSNPIKISVKEKINDKSIKERCMYVILDTKRIV